MPKIAIFYVYFIFVAFCSATFVLMLAVLLI